MQPSIATFNTILDLGLRISAVDVGANPVNGSPPYAEALRRGDLDLVGFEPNPEALAELNKMKGRHETYLPYAVGDGAVRTLRVCASQCMTSLLEPNPALFPYFHGFAEWCQVLARVPLQTVSLDNVPEIKSLDYLKIDIQGAELMVFQSARRLLSECVVIQTEVEFLPIYQDQPLFSEVEMFLRSQGFILHQFGPHPFSRMVSPMVAGNNPLRGLNQIVDFDAVFVRDFTKPERMSSTQMLRMAMIMHDIYHSFDVSLRLLDDHDCRFGTTYAQRYLAHIAAATA